MRAAIYARYSSENQRPESIEDQVGSCRKLAAARGFTVAAANIFTDQAASGARSDRKGLAALLVAAKAKEFEILLVDDLSRLARDNLLMLTTIAELHFHGIKVVSVADGLEHERLRSEARHPDPGHLQRTATRRPSEEDPTRTARTETTGIHRRRGDLRLQVAARRRSTDGQEGSAAARGISDGC